MCRVQKRDYVLSWAKGVSFKGGGIIRGRGDWAGRGKMEKVKKNKRLGVINRSLSQRTGSCKSPLIVIRGSEYRKRDQR